LVRIDTPEQALEFVRLFSSPQTWYQFDHFGYMAVSCSPSDKGDLLPGKVRCPRFHRLGLREAEVMAHEGRFRICRSVVRMERHKVTGVAIVDETVAPDGEYVLRVLCEERVRRLESPMIHTGTPHVAATAPMP